MALLAHDLRRLPPATRKLLVFMPLHVSRQGLPGSDTAAIYAACKRQVVQLARTVPATMVVDFLIPSAITRPVSNYWDPLHYRVPVAARLMAEIAAASRGQAPPDGRVLLP